RAHVDRLVLEKALGLYPPPPRTALNASVTGVLSFEGYRLEKLRYESRPDVLVTAHLYLPEGAGPFPLVLSPHGHWVEKKATRWVQARAISLALYGFATLVIDSPGYSWENCDNEREGMGTHDDPFLAMGAPVTGQYVWDVSRGLDYCLTRPEVDGKRVGITGESGGGTTTIYAFAYDERIAAAVPVVAASSMETQPHNGCFCNHLPGIMNLGDRSDVLSLRAPAPVLIIGASDDPEFPPNAMSRTHAKLRETYSLFKAEEEARLEIVFGPHDYNRRMREAMLAFFLEKLKGEPRRPHVPELRPLVDGGSNPAPAGTLDAHDPALTVLPREARQTKTFREILRKSLDEPHPARIDAEGRLVPWAKYGRIEDLQPGNVLRLHDPGQQATADSIELPVGKLDLRSLIYLGLSVPEFLAQVLHYRMPGRPEGWEKRGLESGDALTAMIASVKTLVDRAAPEEAPERVLARGPVASMTAWFLRLLRPEILVEASDAPTAWQDILERGHRDLIQPGARYLAWPVATAVAETATGDAI
ncbi:MAG TPA: acetylxylan esterase, partial [Fimbriimonadaceae bacterium]|nr:acetylxylan esterase [Fimbriimonadaceae bacterium]